MKSRKVSLLVALLVAVCLTGVAQSQINVNVPFNFSVGKQSLPAGRYKVAPLDDKDQAAWLVSNDHGSVVVLTNPVESSNKAHRLSLVFLQTPEGYALLQIWSSEHLGQDLLLKPKVTTIILAERRKYVEIGAE